MRLLLDENIAVKTKSELYELGYNDIIHINDLKKGMSDIEVYNKAKKENRIIITSDKHFRQKKLNLNKGIIFITPSGKLCEDLSIKIKWILVNISNYNIDINTSIISISNSKFSIIYNKKEKIKTKNIEFIKIDFVKFIQKYCSPKIKN